MKLLQALKIIVGNNPTDWAAGIAFALFLPIMYIFMYMIGGTRWLAKREPRNCFKAYTILKQ